MPVLNVLFSTGKTIFCRERSSRHSLGQAESSGKDDISHCQQVLWYFHLSRVIRQESPSLTDEPQEPILCVTSTEITGIICKNMIKPGEFSWVMAHFLVHAVHRKRIDFHSV